LEVDDKDSAGIESDFAAYLANVMDRERRAAFTVYLANNAEARELLIMAYRAMKSETAHGRDRGNPGRV
jgi:hypothetical protein